MVVHLLSRRSTDSSLSGIIARHPAVAGCRAAAPAGLQSPRKCHCRAVCSPSGAHWGAERIASRLHAPEGYASSPHDASVALYFSACGGTSSSFPFTSCFADHARLVFRRQAASSRRREYEVSGPQIVMFVSTARDHRAARANRQIVIYPPLTR